MHSTHTSGIPATRSSRTGVFMDYAEMLGDAFAYTKEGVLENGNRWLKLVLAVICLALPFNGYVMRVYRGAKPAPEADGWGVLFVDGLRMLVVGIVYAIPIILLWIAIYVPFFLMILNGNPEDAAIAAWEPNPILMLLLYIADFAIAIVLPVAYIRFARTGSFAEAFNFSGIFETIGRIGWLGYIVGIVLVSLVVAIPVVILMIGFIIIGAVLFFLLKGAGILVLLGLLLLFILFVLAIIPPFTVFQARFMTRLYDSGAPAEPAP